MLIGSRWRELDRRMRRTKEQEKPEKQGLEKTCKDLQNLTEAEKAMHGLYQRRLVRHSGGSATVSRVVHDPERPRPLRDLGQ
jgi:hypothetical protein